MRSHRSSWFWRALPYSIGVIFEGYANKASRHPFRRYPRLWHSFPGDFSPSLSIWARQCFLLYLSILFGRWSNARTQGGSCQILLEEVYGAQGRFLLSTIRVACECECQRKLILETRLIESYVLIFFWAWNRFAHISMTLARRSSDFDKSLAMR